MNDRFLRAARGETVDTTPVWFMRQAGRSLPEYRKIRERWRLVDIVADADLCAEVTLQPVRRLGVDAAVMFADIMLPLAALGIDFEFVEEKGPVIAEPIRTASRIDSLKLRPIEEAVPQVMAAVRRVVAAAGVPVICFSGGPFTLASYLIEGGPSRDFALVKRFMQVEPEAFSRLLAKLAEMASAYLVAQVEAGASALQVFDSWVGVLSPADYRQHILPHTRHIFESTGQLSVPRIHFGTGTAGLLESIVSAGPDVVSLDWRIDLDVARACLGEGIGIQGNLDPITASGPIQVALQGARDVLKRAAGRPGHIFNLGHGVLPETPVENLQALVELVHEAGAGGDG